jgi:hypothetical protein
MPPITEKIKSISVLKPLMLDDFTAAAYWTVVACKNILFLGSVKTQDTLLGKFYTLGNHCCNLWWTWQINIPCAGEA